MGPLEQVVISATPRTIHLVDHRLARTPGAIKTLCGRFGIGQPVRNQWRHCGGCRRQVKALSFFAQTENHTVATSPPDAA